jgi:hypothetical protein
MTSSIVFFKRKSLAVLIRLAQRQEKYRQYPPERFVPVVSSE